MKRILITFLVFLVSGVVLFFIYTYYTKLLIVARHDLQYGLLLGEQLLKLFLSACAFSALLLVILTYTILNTRHAARKYAYSLTKDISFSRERFRRFYELSPVPYLLINDDGLIKRPNKAALRFFGTVAEKLINTNIFSYMVHPTDPAKIEHYQYEVKRGLPIEKKEVQVRRSDGTLRWVLLSIEELSDGEGGHQGLVTLVDIHDQKEIDRIKTEFLSLASHQLRAPLANLKWYIDFLLKRRKDVINEEVETYLQKMYRRNEDMIDLVNTLLNLSRIEMGRIKVQKETVNLVEIVQGVLEEVLPSAEEKNITIETQHPNKIEALTDGKLVRIIVQNLLTNAVRYTPKGGKVRVGIEGAGHEAILTVADTGIGIPPEEQEKIFQKLYRASNARSVEVNGNGIGLYMCKSLVEGLGGSISFSSTVGEGTTFVVRIPTT